MPNYNELWNQIESELKSESSMSKDAFHEWIDAAEPLSLKDDVLTILLPSFVHRSYWNDHIKNSVMEHAYKITGKPIRFELVLKDEIKEEAKTEPVQTTLTPEPEKQPSSEFMEETKLNSKYTFETFVTGSGNQMAHAAALAVSEDPGTLYNPLFFYGGVGLGKTHLMHAIGHQILKNDPKTRVKYVTSEAFTNDFINSIQKNRQEEFHQTYRNVDLLLVDDVQFFADKEATQEEFFHTFESLYNDQKQIVLTSDRLPNEIPKLQERLVSRFKWGLSVDITPPNLETRIAILREKALADEIEIPDETLNYIANQVDSNIRELEGAMARIQAYATLQNAQITTELASEALKSLNFGTNLSHLTIDIIQNKVAAYFHVTVSEIKGKKRTKSIVIPRQVAMYLARELTDNSLPMIGVEFGGKDHTTVLHAYEKIKKDIETDDDLQRQVGDLKSELKP
ncbi:chromosomal replication initiator protein DnaA [Pediococcus argentinicus]|uniref:chromosomal replication initiator protein DnaA n=1 Tax=Pediococcus argentinicus TaxID=480391 RepID=UPI00338DF59A